MISSLRNRVRVGFLVALLAVMALRGSVHRERFHEVREELVRYEDALQPLRTSVETAEPLPAGDPEAMRLRLVLPRTVARAAVSPRPVRRESVVPSERVDGRVETPPEFYAFDEREALIELVGHVSSRGESLVCATIVDEARVEVHENIWLREGEMVGAHECVAIHERRGRVRAVFHDTQRASVARAELEITE